MLPKSSLRPLVLLTFLLASFSVLSQVNVVHVGPGFTQDNFEGIYYTLPRTAVKIDLRLDKVTKIQGPFSQYAGEYLGLDEVVDRDRTAYQLKQINVSTIAEPDPEQVYFMARSDRSSREEEALLISLNSSGVFMGAELLKPLEEQSFGLVTTDRDMDPDSIERYFRYLAVNNLGIKIDTITKKITIDTTTIYRHTYKSRTIEKSDEQKAREAVEQIELIRSNRFNIITGYQEVPYSKEAMEYMLGQLTRMEEEYLDLFRGKIIKNTVNYSFLYIPKTEDANEEWIPVFGLSERDGFQRLQDANDELFYVGFQSEGISQHTGSGLADKGKTIQSLPFRVPERVAISVKYRGKSYNVMMADIAQFGSISILPVGTTKMNVHPGTGAIKSVLIEY